MDRSISVTRTYSLGNYKNIKFSDTISGIPDELANNTEFMNELRFLQIVGVDKNYFDYVQNAENWHNLNIEDAIATLDSLEKETVASLKETLDKYEIKDLD